MSAESSSAAPSHADPPVAAGASAPRARSVQGELETFLHTLLASQCALVGGVGGVVYLSPSAARRGGIAARLALSCGDSEGELEPGVLDDPALMRRLERLGSEAARPVSSNGQASPGQAEALTIARGGIYEAQATHRALASPLMAEGRAEGASIVLVPASRRIDEGAALERLALAGARFESFLWRQQALAEAHQKLMLRETLELLDTSQQGSSAEAMGSLLCHELQRRFGCTRVSIGLVTRGPVRLTAVSGADEIDRKGPAVEALEAAMEECADQDSEIVYPPLSEAQADPSQRRVTRAHESLARRFGPATILSLPLRVEGDLVGVVLLEREETQPFPAGAIPLLRLVAEFIGPCLWTRRMADRGILAVARDRTMELGEMLVGPRHTGAKLLGVLALLSLIVLAIPVWPKRVVAATEVKAATSRSIAAPFVGYLARVYVKPGDAVAPGALLAHMETAELELEAAEARSQRDALQAELDNAMATGEFGKAASLTPQIKEVEARIAFVEDHIRRSEVRAPIGGRVSRGDLEAFVGARVEPSQMLFELVTADNVVTVEVDERDVRLVRPGMRGTMTTRALPGEPVSIVVDRVNPTAQVVRGTNVYLAEASLLEAPAWLRPGLTGRARLDVTRESGRRVRTSGLDMILGPLVDEVRLRLWW